MCQSFTTRTEQNRQLVAQLPRQMQTCQPWSPADRKKTQLKPAPLAWTSGFSWFVLTGRPAGRLAKPEKHQLGWTGRAI